MALDSPIEILHDIINYLDDITTIRFLSTCTFLHKQKIKCRKLLIRKNYGCYISQPDSLVWYTEIDKIKSNCGTLLLTITDLNQYFNICKYQYMYSINKSILPLIRIYGFYTDMELDILTNIIYRNSGHNNIITFEIIEHNIFRQVIFKNIICHDIYIYLNRICRLYINIFYSSEIIKGRHSMYLKNNIKVDHTTLDEIEISNKSYFVSCYTESINFKKN